LLLVRTAKWKRETAGGGKKGTTESDGEDEGILRLAEERRGG
jgi:hypothetical protein